MSARPIQERIFRESLDLPAWKSVLHESKMQETKDLVALKFMESLDTVESESAPYPTKPEEIKPYWNYVFSVFVNADNLKNLTGRIKIVVKVIMTAILGKVVVVPDPENVPGNALKSMIEAIGVDRTVEFMAILATDEIQSLVQVLDTESPGLIDRLVVEQNI